MGCTHGAQLGFSENCIQKMGRWNFDAVRSYIRIDSFILQHGERSGVYCYQRYHTNQYSTAVMTSVGGQA